MTLKGKKKGTVLKEFAGGDRSELKTASYKPAEIPSVSFLVRRGWGIFLNTDILREHLVTCLLEVDCLCWGMGVAVQDHSLPRHKDSRCE